MATIPDSVFTVTMDWPVRVTAVTPATRRPPSPFVCQRCGKARGYRHPDEACCNWRGQYRGRHRKVG